MIVVADATPLIALAKIKHLGILAELFGRVVIPQSVYDEVVTKALNRAGASEVAKAVFLIFALLQTRAKLPTCSQILMPEKQRHLF